VVQLEGYRLSFVFKYFLSNHRLIFCLSLPLSFVFSILRLLNIISYDADVILSFCLLIVILVMLIYKVKNCKLVFTKRVCRIFILSLAVFLFLIFCILKYIRYVDSASVAVFPWIVCCILFFSILVLIPIEKIIGCYYISKSKKILMESNCNVRIGITGSFGKTSVKTILDSILNEHFVVLTTPKNYNTPFGISKTINNMLDVSHQLFLCEMGAKKVGEINELCKIVNPNYAIVTSVGRQHTDTFGGIDGVFKTKKELPDWLNGSPCVFNLMNLFTRKMFNGYKGFGYGVLIVKCHNKNNAIACLKGQKKYFPRIYNSKLIFYEFCHKNVFYAKRLRCFQDYSSFSVFFDRGYLFDSKIMLVGEHNVINALLAIAMAFILKVPKEKILVGLSSVKFIEARLQSFILSSGAILINNGYNSNIDSCEYAFKTLKLYNKPRKVIVTPGLVETENAYLYNFEFGKVLSKYANEVVIVKDINKKAIVDGLIAGGFDITKVSFSKSFVEFKKMIESYGVDCVILIENDLPDNYK